MPNFISSSSNTVVISLTSILKIIRDESSTKLVTISKGNTIQLVATKNDNTINLLSTNEDRAINEISISNNEVDKVGIIDINSTKVFKLTKSKDLI